jgi:hypothetical protein
VPYTASRTTLTITTAGVRFPYLTVNPDTVKWGREIHHETRLLDGRGNPLTGVLVQFQWYYGGAWRTVCEASTDSLGHARCRWTVPYVTSVAVGTRIIDVKFPCNTFSVRAYAPSYGVASEERTVKVYSETQITASSNKTSYAPGEDVTVSGRLQEITPTGTAPLANMTVSITWWDGTKTTVTTGSDGGFSATKKAPTTTGTHSVTVEFAGVGLGLEVPVAGVSGRIITTGAIALATMATILAPKLIHSIRVR